MTAWMFGAGSGIMLLALAATGCGRRPPDAPGLASLTVGVAAPIIRQSATPLGLTYHRDALTRETLLTLGQDGRPAPRVLESWQTSADGLTWRLRIRPGIRFHDSTPVTARELAPRVRGVLMAGRLGQIESVEADGDGIIVVRLREPFAFLVEDLGQATALRTVRQRDASGKTSERTYGTGPYVVVAESGDNLQLAEFPNHYRGDPGVSRIAVRLFPDQRNAWSALMRDEIDVLYEVSRESLDFVRSESTVNVATFPRAYVYVLGFNSAIPALRSPAVRRAINIAIDRGALVETALSGEGEPASGHLWPRHWAYDAAVRAPAYDPAGARRLMEEAGLPLRAVADEMPSRLRLRCAVYKPFRQVALVLQRQLAEADIDLQLEELELGEMVERIGTSDYDTFLFEMTSGRTLLWPYLFWHSTSPFLKHGYAGADDVLERMRMARSDHELREAARAFQRRLLDDPPAAFLAWGRVSRAVTNRFELPAAGDDIYHTIPQWKPAGPPRRTND